MTANQSKTDKFQAALNKFYDKFLLADIGEIIDEKIRKDKLEEAERIRKMIEELKNGIDEKFFISKKIDFNYHSGGSRNYANNTDMNMKDIKELCKTNQIKLSKKVNDKSVVYTKRELIIKLKRRKVM